VIEFQNFVLENILSSFQKDEKRVKLLSNFEAKYPEIMKELNSHGEFGLFETISTILELNEKSFEAVSDKALEFRGNGGLKIDTHYSDSGFDYDSFIGSIISFKLAGVEEHYIAYSIFEAIADMAITTLNQLKTKLRIDKFIMMGDMFENTILYSRILSKFQLSSPYFSKSFALDS
jgi:hydrogenase maturation factor HypF (carbamoyltransferase family)